MNILLLVAHGSRREESNLEVESLSKKMLKFNSNQFDEVMPAFLEFASPSITEAIQKCSEIGARRVTVLPTFSQLESILIETFLVKLKRLLKIILTLKSK